MTPALLETEKKQIRKRKASPSPQPETPKRARDDQEDKVSSVLRSLFSVRSAEVIQEVKDAMERKQKKWAWDFHKATHQGDPELAQKYAQKIIDWLPSHFRRAAIPKAGHQVH